METLKYASSRQKEIRLETDIITLLLDALGSPQLSNKYIHITGTNGKGSVASFIDAICLNAEMTTCRFISPHLTTLSDSLLHNGKQVTEKELEAIFLEIEPAAEKVEKQCGRYPSQFELLTAAAFLYFKRRKPDIVIIEVGMGGEGDATNVIPSPVAAVITPISVDHTSYLGATVKDIALRKSAIIKKGCRVVSAVQPADAERILREKAAECHADFTVAEPFPDLGFDEIYEKVCLDGREITLSLGGIAQRENAAIAVKTARHLGISSHIIARGLASAIHPARLEKINERLYFDGAHNISGATALRQSLDRYFPHKKIRYIMGVMKDKPFEEMLEILNRENSSFIFIPFKNNERAALPDTLLSAARKKGFNAGTADGFKSVLTDAREITLVCGSLYLYKDFTEEL